MRIVVVCFILLLVGCSPDKSGSNTSSSVLSDQLPLTYVFEYSIALKEKKIEPHSISKFENKIIVRTRSGRSEYMIKEVVTNDQDRYEIVMNGGNVTSGKAMDYNLLLTPGLVKKTRVSDGEEWWYADHNGRPIFEATLDNAGHVFHR